MNTIEELGIAKLLHITNPIKPIRWYDSKNRRVYIAIAIPTTCRCQVETFYNGRSLGSDTYGTELIPDGVITEIKLLYPELCL